MDMVRRLGLFAKGAGLVLAVIAALAWVSPAAAESFDQLPPGEQKIARALFEAQKGNTASGAPTPLTLDQIAARKKPGKEGWGEVFKEMKAQGFVSEKNMGQVVSSYEQRHRGSGDAASGRSHGVEGRAAGESEASKGMRSGDGSKPGGPSGGFGRGGGRGR